MGLSGKYAYKQAVDMIVAFVICMRVILTLLRTY